MSKISDYALAATAAGARFLGLDNAGKVKNFSPDQVAQSANVVPTGAGATRPLADVAAKAFPSAPDTKRIVILGSSNGAGVGSSSYAGDPTAANGYASPPTSWAGLLTAALQAIDPAWTIINRSLSGTGTVQSIARFWTDVAPYRPSHVMLVTHPLNDGLDTQLTLRNTEMLCRMCDSIGAIPIIRGAYTYNSYTAAQYQAALSLNRALDLLGRHRIDHMSTLDNGAGAIIGGTTYQVGDGLHLTDAGQEVHFRGIDLGLFFHAAATRLVERAQGTAWQVQAATPVGTGIVVGAATGLLLPPRSYTMRARVKGVASGGTTSRAFMCAYGEGDVGAAAPIRFRNANAPYDIGDATSSLTPVSNVSPNTDATVHDLVMVVNHAANTISGYIDGVSFVSAAPGSALTPCKTFTFGGRGESGNGSPAAGYTFADLAIWASALRPEAVSDLYRTNRLPPASLLFAGGFGGSPGVGGLVPNVVANGILPVIGEALWQAAPSY